MNKLKFLAVILGVTMIFTSCDKDDDGPTTGSLKIYVKMNDGTREPVVNQWVSLANSLNNLNQGYYVTEVSTNDEGLADFGQIAPKTYYYDCYAKIGNEYYYAKGEATVKAGNTVTKELLLDKE